MEGESEQLSQLEQIFRQPDAVMEPNIFDTVVQYVAAHGKPRTAIELLCENYVGEAHHKCPSCRRGSGCPSKSTWRARIDAHAAANLSVGYAGYAQMGSLVCDWLALTNTHAQRADHQHGNPSQDLSAPHFLRVRSNGYRRAHAPSAVPLAACSSPRFTHIHDCAALPP